MPFDGSGNYATPAGTDAVTGSVIASGAYNAFLADVELALSNTLTRDGQSAPSQNLPMGGKKLTNLGAGSGLTDSAQLSQVQEAKGTWLTGVAGTDTITASTTPAPTAYTTGQVFRFTAAATNTGAVTLNVASLGARSLTKQGGSALAAGDLVSGRVYEVLVTAAGLDLLNYAVTPAAATVTVAGVVELATSAETITGTDADRAVTPAGLEAKVASTTAKGIVELATAAETITGTDTTRAVTPSGMASFGLGVGQTWQFPSRTAGTTYQNTTGKPIQVSITWTGGDGGTADLYVDTASSPANVIAKGYQIGAGIKGQLSAIVPNNHYYKCVMSGDSVDTWAELR
jgi:hypothetical protein